MFDPGAHSCRQTVLHCVTSAAPIARMGLPEPTRTPRRLQGGLMAVGPGGRGMGTGGLRCLPQFLSPGQGLPGTAGHEDGMGACESSAVCSVQEDEVWGLLSRCGCECRGLHDGGMHRGHVSMQPAVRMRGAVVQVGVWVCT